MTARIHLYVIGQVAQSQSLSPPPHLTLSLGPCPLDNDAHFLLSYRSSSSTVSVVRTLNACAPILGIPSSAHAPTPKPPSRCPNWTMTATPGQKPGCPKIGSGGECPPHGLTPRPVQSFPSLLAARGSKPSWQNNMPTPALPHHILHLRSEKAHALGLPTTAADDVSFDARLNL